MPGYPENLPKILYLPRWYPHRNNLMEGLFVRELAESLASVAEITVLYVFPDPDCLNRFEMEYSREHSVDVLRVSYPPARTWLGNGRRFYAAHKRGLDLLQGYRPDLIHAHVFLRNAVMAYLLGKRFRAPFIVSEHWSRFFRGNPGFPGMLHHRAIRFIASKASALVAVSGMLKEALEQAGITNRNFYIVPNPVDTGLFQPVKSADQGPERHFIHVSCFDDRPKNISGLLQAVQTLSGKRSDFVCHLAGEGPDLDRMKNLAKVLGLLPDRVVFEGLKSREELAELLSGCDFSVLSSRYETFATVIVESMACGVPVLSTPVGIAPEVVNPETGILIPADDQKAMVRGLEEMLDRSRDFDRDKIRANVRERFDRSSVAHAMLSVYHKILSLR